MTALFQPLTALRRNSQTRRAFSVQDHLSHQHDEPSNARAGSATSGSGRSHCHASVANAVQCTIWLQYQSNNSRRVKQRRQVRSGHDHGPWRFVIFPIQAPDPYNRLQRHHRQDFTQMHVDNHCLRTSVAVPPVPRLLPSMIFAYGTTFCS